MKQKKMSRGEWFMISALISVLAVIAIASLWSWRAGIAEKKRQRESSEELWRKIDDFDRRWSP